MNPLSRTTVLRTLLLSSGIFAGTLASNGQNIFPVNGKVGIGTSNPSSLLDVRGGSVLLQNGANVFYRAFPYLTIGHSMYNYFPYISFNALLTTSDVTTKTNSFTPQFPNGGGLVIKGDAGGSALHFLQKQYNGNAGEHNISSFNESLTLSPNGNVGIGNANPFTLLSVSKATASTEYGGYTSVEISNPSDSAAAISAFVMKSGSVTAANVPGAVGGLYTNATNNTNQYFWVRSFKANYPLYLGFNKSDMTILNGNVLIGQMTQGNNNYKLDVKGTIHADQLVVSTTGADYVFEPDYKLSSLQSVEKYVTTYHHLPGIPAAKEMQAQGLKVGDNQMLLLQKIEELTLYVIDQDKKQATQEQIIQQQHSLLQQQQELLQKMQIEIDKLKADKL